jgi:hypothetical protein
MTDQRTGQEDFVNLYRGAFSEYGIRHLEHAAN